MLISVVWLNLIRMYAHIFMHYIQCAMSLKHQAPMLNVERYRQAVTDDGHVFTLFALCSTVKFTTFISLNVL